MVSLMILLVVFLAGIVFQSLLHGASRMLISAFIGFLGGLITGITGNLIPLFFALGCLGRMIIGGHIVCIILMVIYVSAGFVVGHFVF